MRTVLQRIISLAVMLAFLSGATPSPASLMPRSTLAPTSHFRERKPSAPAKKRADAVPVPEKSNPYDQMKAAAWICGAADKEGKRVREKIIRHIRHVTFDEFHANLKKMVAKLNTILKDGKEYGVILDGVPHASKRWVYELAKREGLASQPVWETYFDPFTDDCKRLLMYLKEQYGGRLPGRIVIFDDASYQGRQLYHLLGDLYQAYAAAGERRPEVILAVPYMSRAARRLLAGMGVTQKNILSGERIMMLDEILTAREQEVIQQDVLKGSGKDFSVHTSVTYFDHRVADLYSFNAPVAAALDLYGMITAPYWVMGTAYYAKETKEFKQHLRRLSEARKWSPAVVKGRRGGRWPWLAAMLGRPGQEGWRIDLAQVAIEQTLWAVTAVLYADFAMPLWGALAPAIILFTGLHYIGVSAGERAPPVVDVAAVSMINIIAAVLTASHPEALLAVTYLAGGTLHFLYNKLADQIALSIESVKLRISAYRPGPVPRLFTKESLMERAGVPVPLWERLKSMNKGKEPHAVHLTGVSEDLLVKLFSEQTAHIPDDELVFVSVEYFTTENTLSVFSQEVQVIRHIALVARTGELRERFANILDGTISADDYLFLLYFGEYPQRRNIHFYRVQLDEALRGNKLMSAPEDNIAAILKANFPGQLLTAYVTNLDAIYYFLKSRGLNPVWAVQDRPDDRGTEVIRLVKEYEGAHAKPGKVLYAVIPGTTGSSAVSTVVPEAATVTVARLTDDENNNGVLVREIARAYGLDVTGVRYVEGGAGLHSEKIPVIMTPDGEYALKRLKLGEDEDAVRFAIDYQRYLKENGIPVPIIAKRGTSGGSVGDYYMPARDPRTGKTGFYQVEKWNPGRLIDREKATPETLRHVGQLLGKIHRLSARYQMSYRDRSDYSYQGAVDFITAPDAVWKKKFSAYISAGELSFMNDVIAEIKTYWTPERLKSLPMTAIPSDMNFGNMVFDEAGTQVKAVFDFDQARRGCPLEDFFATLVHTGRKGAGMYTKSLKKDLTEFLSGYVSEYTLSPGDISLLPALATAQIMVHLSYTAELLTGDPVQDASLVKRLKELLRALEEIRGEFGSILQQQQIAHTGSAVPQTPAAAHKGTGISGRDKGAPAEYFGEQMPEEVDPQIRDIMSDPKAERYYFVQGLAGAQGRSDEGHRGNLQVGDMYEEAVIDACREIIKVYPELAGYDVVIVKGASFSGHYGVSRTRIYLPIELLIVGMLTHGRLMQMGFIEDFIEHEFLESRGAHHSDVVKRLSKKRPGLRELAVVACRLYYAEQMAERGQAQKALDGYRAALRALKKVSALERREKQIDDILRLIKREGRRDGAAGAILKILKNHFKLSKMSAERLDLAFELEKVALLIRDRFDPGGRTARLAAPPIMRDGVPVPAAHVPFDRALAGAWVENSATEEVKEVKWEIINNVRQVSFAEFEERLREVTIRLNGMLAKEKGEYVVLWDEDAHKSKKWVFSLAQKWLQNPPAYQTTSATLDYYLMKYGSFPKTVVLFDDASYSGKQLAGDIINIRASAGFHGVPVPRIIIAVPFMTEQARAKLVAYGVRESDILSVEKIPTIEEIFGERSAGIAESIQTDEVLKGGDMQYFGLNKTLVFFDHKTPDLVSFADIVAGALALKEGHLPPYRDPRTAYYMQDEEEYSSFEKKRHLARIIKSGLKGYGNEVSIQLILKACEEEHLGVRDAALDALGEIIKRMLKDARSKRDMQEIVDAMKEFQRIIDEAA